MAKKHEFSILALFSGKAAMRGINRFGAKVKARLAGLAKATQRFAGIGKAGRPGGVGGIFAGLLQGATSVLLLPVKLIGAFAKLIPGIGSILGGIFGTPQGDLDGVVDNGHFDGSGVSVLERVVVGHNLLDAILVQLALDPPDEVGTGESIEFNPTAVIMLGAATFA